MRRPPLATPRGGHVAPDMPPSSWPAPFSASSSLSSTASSAAASSASPSPSPPPSTWGSLPLSVARTRGLSRLCLLLSFSLVACSLVALSLISGCDDCVADASGASPRSPVSSSTSHLWETSAAGRGGGRQPPLLHPVGDGEGGDSAAAGDGDARPPSSDVAHHRHVPASSTVFSAPAPASRARIGDPCWADAPYMTSVLGLTEVEASLHRALVPAQPGGWGDGGTVGPASLTPSPGTAATVCRLYPAGRPADGGLQCCCEFRVYVEAEEGGGVRHDSAGEGASYPSPSSPAPPESDATGTFRVASYSCLPRLVVAGEMKGGTTALFRALLAGSGKDDEVHAAEDGKRVPQGTVMDVIRTLFDPKARAQHGSGRAKPMARGTAGTDGPEGGSGAAPAPPLPLSNMAHRQGGGGRGFAGARNAALDDGAPRALPPFRAAAYKEVNFFLEGLESARLVAAETVRVRAVHLYPAAAAAAGPGEGGRSRAGTPVPDPWSTHPPLAHLLEAMPACDLAAAPVDAASIGDDDRGVPLNDALQALASAIAASPRAPRGLEGESSASSSPLLSPSGAFLARCAAVLGRVVVDASPLYLSSPAAQARMAALLPHAHVLVVHRNPTDRAYSEFQHASRSDGGGGGGDKGGVRDPAAWFAHLALRAAARLKACTPEDGAADGSVAAHRPGALRGPTRLAALPEAGAVDFPAAAAHPPHAVLDELSGGCWPMGANITLEDGMLFRGIPGPHLERLLALLHAHDDADGRDSARVSPRLSLVRAEDLHRDPRGVVAALERVLGVGADSGDAAGEYGSPSTPPPLGPCLYRPDGVPLHMPPCGCGVADTTRAIVVRAALSTAVRMRVVGWPSSYAQLDAEVRAELDSALGPHEAALQGWLDAHPGVLLRPADAWAL
jgi:hypothetical protein